RMSVDLPEPLAPRIPWMSPRSRRIDTWEIAVTGGFFRLTTNRLVTSSMRRAGTTEVAGSVRSEPIGSTGWPTDPFFSSGLKRVVTWDSRIWCCRGGGDEKKPRASSDGVGGPRGSGAPDRRGDAGHQKSRGPDLAH